jgi:hypothetical protein
MLVAVCWLAHTPLKKKKEKEKEKPTKICGHSSCTTKA